MISGSCFAVDIDRLQSFLDHGRQYEAELLMIQQRHRRAKNEAYAATGYQPGPDAANNLAALWFAAGTTNRFVRSVARGFDRRIEPALLNSGLLEPIWSWSTNTGEGGVASDAGGSLTWRDNANFAGAKAETESGHDAGLAVLNRSFTDLADNTQIAADEFEAIIHTNGNVTLVLPGVIDLSRPHLGYDPVSRSSRDLDQVAVGSAFSSELDDNAYGQMVAAFVADGVTNGLIKQGADVLIVGHSFGADTALDLAASSQFNGGLVNVTHVVAAGYHNEPQLRDVTGSTKVAVLQNINDVPVIAEGVVADLRPKTWNDRSWARGSGIRSVGRAAIEVGERVLGLSVGLGHVPIKGDRVQEIGQSVVLAEFEGGADRFGHHPDHYSRYLNRTSPDPAVTSFVEGIEQRGYGQPGRVVAVDVSLPDPIGRQN